MAGARVARRAACVASRRRCLLLPGSPRLSSSPLGLRLRRVPSSGWSAPAAVGSDRRVAAKAGRAVAGAGTLTVRVTYDGFLALWQLDSSDADTNASPSDDTDLSHEGLLSDSPIPGRLASAFCRRTFERGEKLKEHAHEHAFPVIVSLDAIDYSQPFLAGLAEHLTPGQFPRFQCPKCPASFTLKSNMDRHEKTIHFNRKKMQCPHCLKLFRDKTDLNRHLMSVHSQERSFACLFCGKGFGTQKNLATHVKVCYLGSAQPVAEELLNDLGQDQESEEE